MENLLMNGTPSISGSIHKVREFELEKVNLAEEFDVLQIVGEGWYGKILLAEHRSIDAEIVLKILPKAYTPIKDFFREFHYGLHLTAHQHIITTYDVAFETAGFYVFAQEYAPLGDLASNVTDTGIGETYTRRVARQLAAALSYMHSRGLVHRDVKLDNVLVFRMDFSRVKLCDFGETCRTGTLVRRHNEWLPYAPPEVFAVPTDDMYKAEATHDVWQFGIVIFVCLTGCLPWQKASSEDPRHSRYLTWHASTNPFSRPPKLFRNLTSKAQRLFRKFLEPKQERRPTKFSELDKLLYDRWICKGYEKSSDKWSPEEDGLCPSMYSFHSSPEEKNKLLSVLRKHGIETTVDRSAKKDRIREWIQNSVIMEDEEPEEEDSEYEDDTDEDRDSVQNNENLPLAESTGSRRSIQQKHSQEPRKITPVRFKNPIDPRIPLEKQKEKLSKENQAETSDYGSENSSQNVHTIKTTFMYDEKRKLKTKTVYHSESLQENVNSHSIKKSDNQNNNNQHRKKSFRR